MDPQNPPGSGGSGVTLGAAWKYDTGVADANPGNKNFRFNNADPTLATFIYVNDTTNDGVDASNILSLLESGELYIQQQNDSTRVNLYKLNGTTTDGGGYWKVPIVYRSTGDTAGYQSNQPCAWIVYTAGTAGGLGAVVDDTSPQYGGFMDTNSFSTRESKGADVASATNVTLLNDGNFVVVTGNTEIETLTDIAVGTEMKFKFAAAPNLKQSASLLLITGSDIQTQAGDFATLRQTATGAAVWEMTSYTRKNGSPLVANGASYQLIIATNKDNYNLSSFITGNMLLAEPSSSGLEITGIDSSDFSDGAELTFILSSSNKLVFKHNDLNSSVGNRFFLPGSEDKTLSGGREAVTFFYNALNQLWMVKSSTVQLPFISPVMVILSGGSVQQTHGFTVTPYNVRAYIKCVIAEKNYIVGDELLVNNAGNDPGSGSSSQGRGLSLVVDSTHVHVRFGNSVSVFGGFNKSTGAPISFTNANWQMYLEVSP